MPEPITDKQFALARRDADTARRHGDGHWHTVLADHVDRLAAEVERLRSEERHLRNVVDRIGSHRNSLADQLKITEPELKRAEAEVERLRGEVEEARQKIGDALVTPGARSWDELAASATLKNQALKHAQDVASMRAGQAADADRRANAALKRIEQAEAERDEARTELAKVSENWRYLSDRVSRLRLEADGRRAYGERLKGEISGLKETVAAGDADRDRLAAENEDLRKRRDAYSNALHQIVGAVVAACDTVRLVRECGGAEAAAEALGQDPWDNVHEMLTGHAMPRIDAASKALHGRKVPNSDRDRLEAELAEAQRVAATLRASRAEIRNKLNEALRAAEAQRDHLAERLAAHAYCDEHAEHTDDCPFCEDRAAYLAYVAGGGRDYRPDFTGRSVPFYEVRFTSREQADG